VIQIFTKSGRTRTPQWSVSVDQGFVARVAVWSRSETAPPATRSLVHDQGEQRLPGDDEGYRDSFPIRFAGLPTRGVSRAGGTSTLPVHRSVAAQRMRQRLLAVRRRRRRNAPLFRLGHDVDEKGVLPNDKEARKAVRGNFSFMPHHNLLFSWNTPTRRTASPTRGGQQRARAHAQRVPARSQLRVRTIGPEVVPDAHQEITSDITHLSPVARSTGARTRTSRTVHVRLRPGADRERNLRPFGFVSAPGGIISSRRTPTRTSPSTTSASYRLNMRRACAPRIRGAARASRRRRARPRPTARTSRTRRAHRLERRQHAGFEEAVARGQRRLLRPGPLRQGQRYFLTLGFRVDGNSAFGENFGLQYYPKASSRGSPPKRSFWPTWNPEMKFRCAWGRPDARRAPSTPCAPGSRSVGAASPRSSRATSAIPTSVRSARPRWSWVRRRVPRRQA
jgi:hypothetical protein